MDELKEAFDYQADSHIFLGSPQPMLRDMRFDDVSMPPEPDDAPVEKRGDRRQRREDIKAVPPKYNEDQLAVMPEWIGASKKMFSVMNDGERFIGSDKQAAAYGLDLMSEFNWNMTGPAGIPGESGISVPGFAFQVAALMSDTAGEENAMTFLQMLHTYSDTSTNGATIKRAFRGIFADPLTYAGGFGKLYAMAAKSLAGKVSGAVLKDMLMKTAAGTAMPYDLAVKYPGRTGMVAGAGYGAGFEGGTMAVEDAAGLEPTVGEAATRLGTAGTVGAAVGGVGSKVLSKAIPAAGSAVRQGLDTAGQAAEARMAERGPITDRVMSGVDPMEVIDPALAAAGKLVRPTKENPVTAVPPTETEPGIIAFHGSGADFDQFSLEKIGTGEGAQAYGYGLYFTDSEDIAKFYKDMMARNVDIDGRPYIRGNQINDNLVDEDIADDLAATNGDLEAAIKSSEEFLQEMIAEDNVNAIRSTSKELEKLKALRGRVTVGAETGKTYKVALSPKPDEFLDYDKPIGNQSPDIKAKISKLIDNEITPDDLENFGSPRGDLKASLLSENRTVVSFLNDFAAIRGKDNAGEELLAQYGIPGIKYFDNTSRNTAGGKLIDVTKAEDGFRAKVAVDNRPGGLGGSGRIVTTSPPYKTRQEALDWADEETKKSGRNYVIFDDKAIKILEKYGIVGPVAITALGAAKQEGADNGDI